MNRVLVTRPQPGAGATARRLESLGFVPVVLPLTEIRGLPVDPLPSVERIDAVAVTSTNAVRHASPRLVAALARKPCFAVGAETAAAASKAGFADVSAGTGDAAALARTVLCALKPGARLLYLCGRARLSAFEYLLREGGLDVAPRETYDAPTIAYPSETVLAMLDRTPVDAALLYSGKAAARLSELAKEPRIRPLLAETRFLCLSERVGAQLADIAEERIFCAEAPDEAALLALLQRQCGNRT